MTPAQLHYTSAPPGPDGSGFRFTAVSAGVPQGLLREAEQLIGYEPPRDFPARPDTEELKSFPKAFAFSELSDGGRLLSRSVYTGADYTGRWGNFHAHAVHLPPGARLPDGALPITAWESPRWSDTTPPDGRPGPVDRFEPSGLLRRDGLVAFAASRQPWLAPFFADLRAVAEDPGAGQLVLVEQDSADVAQWIALACAVLPREQAHRLTFTTYTRRPQQARQQIVGVLPSSEQIPQDHRYRVHDCTRRPPSEPVTDTWAQVCARIWIAGRPDLFRDPVDGLGPLTVAALVEGIGLPSDARAVAARWAAERLLPEATLGALIAGLCRDGEDADEPAALAALWERVDGQVPTAVSAPLAARVLASAVRGGGPVPALRPGSLTPQVHADLARALAPVLREGVADAAQPADGRPLTLLRVADLLGVDCQDLLPELAGRLARALVDTAPQERPAAREHPVGHPALRTAETADATAPRLGTPALLDAVHEHPALRLALFGSLDALAAADPPAAARTLAGSGLPVGLQPGFPHLRMCVLAEPGGDRLARFHGALRTAGASPHADPSVLRTALRLVWPAGDLPTGQEASLLLNELGSDLHRAAGTRDLLIDAALAAPADDRDVPALAADLLRCFTTELRPGQRAALLLLEYAGLLGTPGEGEEWVRRVLSLRDGAADPVPDTVLHRAFDALARRLVADSVPESELYALARSGEPELLAAYERAGRSPAVADRLRVVPSYVAVCFRAWSAFPGTHPAWDETGAALLGKVLRPVVKALPAEDVAEVEAALERAGRSKLDAFRSWNRPGALGRLAGRLSGRGRRAEPGAAWPGDVEPPYRGGRR
ncbi:GTPase-associated protein 1-related protein [Streptomyces sp. YS415]|uniref:GTPase-associated protein 1-related protein n=1 Tax=Streptomyces sp. YS415 TaxID=2944806 RepID=UPI00202004B1|nr:GTPase-associated protein 1-related protein [Streptomyces sp. YS415]MCL7424681.1 GTPase-associated protein 1-related protein [Streptomyces sp. YS415]